jgi:uncharacterized membrane protein YesL
MNILDSRWYRTLEIFSNFFFLNLLWLFLCFPLVTVFPATTALFGVVREWTRDRDSGFFISFFHHLRANFAQSLWIGILWTLLGGILVLNYVLISDMTFLIQLPLFVLNSLWMLSYVSASVYLFPIMANYNIKWWNVIKNSAIIALSQFGITFLCLLIVGFMILLFFYLPMTVLLSGSVTAYLVYVLCDRAFRRVEALQHARGANTDYD